MALYAASESESFVSMHYVDSIKMARAGGGGNDDSKDSSRPLLSLLPVPETSVHSEN